MEKRVAVIVSVPVLAVTIGIVALRQLRVQRERREFAERYAKQLRAARESHEQLLQNGHNASQRSLDLSEADIDEDGAAVRVIYGTESGNAEALAKGFVTTLRDRGVPATLIDPCRWAYLDHYLYHNKSNVPLFHPMRAGGGAAQKGTAAQATGGSSSSPPLVYIFIVATNGEGEPTGNFMSLFQEMQLAVRKATAPASSAPGAGAAAVAAASGGSPAAAPELPFKDIHYAVFGLGDSSYKYYCRCATDTNTLLKKGGGINLHRVGFGDARSGLQEDVFDEWQEKVMQALTEKCGITMTSGTLAPPKPEYLFRFVPAETLTPAVSDSIGSSSSSSSKGVTSNEKAATDAAAVNGEGTGKPIATLPFPPPPALLEPSLLHPTQLRIISRTQLAAPRASDGSAIYRVCFETEGTGISYQAGDHLGIFPTNAPETVARCAAALSIKEEDLDTPVKLCQQVPSRGILRNVLPACVPLRVVLQRYVDLSGRPKKSTLRVLAKYCTDPVEQKAFLQLLQLPADHIQDGQSGDTSNAAKKLRTIADYMEKFPSCCGIPLGHFIEIMPRVQPRYYSIASDRLSHGTQVEIIVRVQPGGLTGTYLVERVSDGDFVFGYVRISSFHLPQRIGENRPLLMIGPGTGAAAMVGICYKKEALMRRQPAAEYGPTMFFFGAQHRASEYFIGEEALRWSMSPREMQQWDLDHPDAHAGLAARRSKVQPPALLPSPVITHHDCAFSRDQEEKVYVTTLIDRHKDQIYDMLTSTSGGGCLVYLSGDASFMAKDVDKALSTLLQEKGGMTRVASLEFLRRMEADHRYLKDVY